MNWYLKIGGVKKSFADWGLSNLRRTRQSGAVDTVSFTADGAAFDSDPFAAAHGDTITIYQDEVQWFVGRITQIPRSGTPTDESLSYTASGPWCWLENLVFRQYWKTGGGESQQLVPRAVLGQDVEGGRMTSGQVLREVLQYAIDCGAPFQIGTIEPAIAIPLDEQKNVVCAEVIRTAMRWTPDAVELFDYSTSPPTIHILQQAGLTAVDLQYGEDQQLVSGLSIVRRDDLRVPAVVICYDVTNNVDGEEQTNFILDTWPAEATGREYGALVMSIPWQGSTITTTRQPVKTRNIQDHFGDPVKLPMVRSWWKKIHPQFANLPDEEWTILDIPGWDPGYLKIQFSDPDQLDDAGEPAVIDGLPNELVDGSITDWMKQSPYNRKGYRVIMTARIQVGVADIQDYQVEITATNAATGVYSTTDVEPGMEPPSGIAEAMFNILNRVQFEGSVNLDEEEVSGQLRPGKALNIIGSRAEWATMNAIVQSVTEDIENGNTIANFGPPQHLSVQNLIELLRVSRSNGVGGRQQNVTGADARTGGKTKNAVTLGGIVPGRNSTAPGSGLTLPFKVILKYEGGGWLAKVSLKSRLLKSLNVNDGLTITGLDTWTSVVDGDKIWLFTEIGGTAYAPSADSATMQFGSGWTGYPNPITIDDSDPDEPRQTAVRQMVASISITGIDGKVVQLLDTDLRLVLSSVDGVICLVYEAAGGPVPA